MPHTFAGARSLERDLRDIFGSRLQSFVVYGQHAPTPADHPGHHDAHPLVHALAIVETLTADDLRACAQRVTAWHDEGIATPLLMASHEFARSLDVFPLEFGAIIADHSVVSGPDPFSGLRIEAADLRRACEVQARSHLLHLREGFLETRGRPDALAVLIVDSAAPFAGLLASIARLQGAAADGSAVRRHAERALDVPGGIVAEVMRLATVKEISSADAVRIFPDYLDAVERLVKYVDAWTGK